MRGALHQKRRKGLPVAVTVMIPEQVYLRGGRYTYHLLDVSSSDYASDYASDHAYAWGKIQYPNPQGIPLTS